MLCDHIKILLTLTGQQGSSVLRLEEARKRDQYHKVTKKSGIYTTLDKKNYDPVFEGIRRT